MRCFLRFQRSHPAFAQSLAVLSFVLYQPPTALVLARHGVSIPYIPVSPAGVTRLSQDLKNVLWAETADT